MALRTAYPALRIARAADLLPLAVWPPSASPRIRLLRNRGASSAVLRRSDCPSWQNSSSRNPSARKVGNLRGAREDFLSRAFQRRTRFPRNGKLHGFPPEVHRLREVAWGAPDQTHSGRLLSLRSSP